LWGNRRIIQEANAGLITSSYNGFNELEKQTDARGYTTKYEYDNLGRVTQKKYVAPAGKTETITYTYDLGNMAIGQLSEIKINDTLAETYTYDTKSRLFEYKKIIDKKPFTHKYTYTANGELEKLT